jgi:hypothetical protein
MVLSIMDISTWEIVKWFVVFGEVIYIIFAFVIVRQVKVMLETLDIGFAYPVRLISYLHFLFALGIIILSVIIL